MRATTNDSTVGVPRDGPIEGTRALAASCVLGFHLIAAIAAERPERIGPGLERATDQLGHLGVAGFFVLSGFLLYRPWLRSELTGERPRVSTYLLRRFARIYPAYWVAAIVYLAWVRPGPSPGAGAWIEYLTLTQGYRAGDQLAGLGVAWSLVIEVSFYLLVPVAATLVRSAPTADVRTRLRRHAAMALAWFAIGHVVRVATVRQDPVPAGSWQFWRFPATWIAGYADWFAYGMAAAVLAVAAERGIALGAVEWVRRHRRTVWALGVATFAAVHLARFPTGRGAPLSEAQQLVRNGVVPLAAALLVTPVLLGAPGALTRALGSRPLVWLGTVSYGLYLWQIVAIRLVRNGIADGTLPASPALLVVTATALTVVAAAASWYLLERPLIGWAGARGRPRVPQA